MTQEISLGQESSQRRLINRRRMLIHYRANLDHRINQLFRREQISDAQGWVKDLAHCSGVDHAAGIIEPLQTRERGTGKTKFRIMIILEDVGVMLARKID